MKLVEIKNSLFLRTRKISTKIKVRFQLLKTRKIFHRFEEKAREKGEYDEISQQL